MSKNDAKSVAAGCLTAWTSGDFGAARALLHDDLRFAGALGSQNGADAYIEGLKAFARMIKSAPQHRIIAEGEDVCIHYDLVTATGAVIPAVGWYQVRGGRISSVQAFFDPRPLLPLLERRA
ncbi:MAG: nuclear transport factor 2 family protein [Deltaproteobacteria bacterium]|nr:nuclear transport factor 2 family protein [Deltaproteobacteria bacterium]MBV8453515.1 nuclear transport factor 2 family protein [Deltaproteobacteria bacterium]